MTTKEVKSEIQKVLDKVPDNLLQDILDYLKTIQSKSSDTVQLSKNLKQIISEDKALLERLAK
ncbi:MAG TPA: hypothetical protein VK809_01475 [Bacteroidia bacterium]|jgi:hypothetical protein|nr:hypothetical protein [Bacteroidia bacterium]